MRIPLHMTTARALARRWPARLACLLLVATTQTACARQGQNMDSSQFDTPAAAALDRAAAAGDAADVRRLIADGANPDATDTRGSTLLQRAMLQNDRKAFELLLEAGADPAAGASNGATAMHVAAMLDDTGWMRTLLDRGVSPDVPNTRNGETPLYNALEAKSDRNIEFLLAAGARTDVVDSSGSTLLHKAARINASAWVLRFLEAGVDPTATDRVGVTFQPSFFRTNEAILSGDARRNRAQVREWLTARGIAVESRD